MGNLDDNELYLGAIIMDANVNPKDKIDAIRRLMHANPAALQALVKRSPEVARLLKVAEQY